MWPGSSAPHRLYRTNADDLYWLLGDEEYPGCFALVGLDGQLNLVFHTREQFDSLDLVSAQVQNLQAGRRVAQVIIGIGFKLAFGLVVPRHDGKLSLVGIVALKFLEDTDSCESDPSGFFGLFELEFQRRAGAHRLFDLPVGLGLMNLRPIIQVTHASYSILLSLQIVV